MEQAFESEQYPTDTVFVPSNIKLEKNPKPVKLLLGPLHKALGTEELNKLGISINMNSSYSSDDGDTVKDLTKKMWSDTLTVLPQNVTHIQSIKNKSIPLYSKHTCLIIFVFIIINTYLFVFLVDKCYFKGNFKIEFK